VSIAREPGWRLAGVMGSPANAQTVLDQLLSMGLDGLLQPLAASRTGTITLRWKAPIRRRPVPPVRRGPTRVSAAQPLTNRGAAPATRKPAAKEAPAKKATSKKAPAKKAPAKRATTKKATTKKATTKKASSAKRASPTRKTSKKITTRARRGKPRR